MRQSLPAEQDYILLRYVGGIRLQLDKRARSLAPFLIRLRDHGRIQDA